MSRSGCHPSQARRPHRQERRHACEGTQNFAMLQLGAEATARLAPRRRQLTLHETSTMAQLQRLRAHMDTHERVFTTVDGFANYVSSLGPMRGTTCTIRMCFLRGAHFSTSRCMPTGAVI